MGHAERLLGGDAAVAGIPGVAPGMSVRLPATPASRITRVLVADSLPVMGVGLRALVESGADLRFCGTVHSVASAVELAGANRLDLVVLDTSLDGAAGGIRALRSVAPTVAVLALVGERDARAYLANTQAGVRAVLRRSAHPSEVVAAIRAVRGGRVFIDPVLARGFTDEPLAAALSERQASVLALVARGYSTTDIATSMNLAVETVRTHVKALMQRLGVHDRAHAVARGYELGILTHRDTTR